MRHHYVPQFLLRAWAETQPDQKVEIFRLDLPDLPSSRHTSKYTAYEDDLYALTMPVVAGMEKQAVEKHLLRRVDDFAARVLRRLITRGLAGLTLDDRCDWARFLMSLRLRQPAIVQQLRTESSEYLEASLIDRPEEYDAIAGIDDPPTLLEWTRKNYPGLIEKVGMSFFRDLVDNAGIGEKILRMRWWLWDFTREQNDLLLANQPCIFTTGIDDADLVIALPIGPRKAFIATRSERAATLLRRRRPEHLLMGMNESSLNQARLRVYARDASPRRFIWNRLAKRRAAEHRTIPA
jgi:hypothetical protein